MAGLYIGSPTPQAGKNLLSFSIGYLLQQQGLSIGYMKPIGKSIQRVEGIAGDTDALIAQELLGQNMPPDIVSPVMLPQGLHNMASVENNTQENAVSRIVSAYQHIVGQNQLTIVCGTESFPATGMCCGADGKRLTDALDTQVLLVTTYNEQSNCDTLLFLQSMLGNRLAGVIINKVPEQAIQQVNTTLVPYLESQDIPVYGSIPYYPSLQGIRVSELAYGLSGYIIAGNKSASRLVESFIIGTMQVDNFMSRLNRAPQRVVIVGGDRADLQIAALLAQCPCLVLTGNLTPCELVRQRAESLGIPIIVVKEDTYAVASTMLRLLQEKKLRDLQQIKQGITLVQQHLDLHKLLHTITLSS